MFVRALATECQLPLIAVQASRIFGRYVGDSERNMRRILVQARASAPAILFIDEIDLLLPSRSSSETGASEHVLGEVLTAMDGVEGQSGQIILIAATNRMDKLDSALSRAGRFDLVIEVPPPDADARLSILCLELSRKATDPSLQKSAHWLQSFATKQLAGYTGAEVVQVVQQAAQLARDANRNQIERAHLSEAHRRCPPRSLRTFKQSKFDSTTTVVPRSSEGVNPRFSMKKDMVLMLLFPFLLALIVSIILASVRNRWFESLYEKIGHPF
ncbi:unnamed protein product [Echinostoma caproni]|uniref:ATPase_AAA_core domain-containing protein n=1 Tax=Echinostoma caproni TaxID=27848 RepID=A0A183ACE3_9TREM|nr:unnamed protein product [Echinostoma caproni]